MKEHRVKALRVTTTSSINRESAGMLGVLRLELDLQPLCLPCERVGHHHHHHQGYKGLECILQECLGCERVPPFDDFMLGRNESAPTSDVLQQLCADDCDESVFKNIHSDEALVAGCRQLLQHGRFGRAAEVARALVAAGRNPDATDAEGRSLLSYAVARLDDAAELTRVLLAAGACVWGGAASPSAFTWFLRAVIRRRRLDAHCSRTLHLLATAMGEAPARMHAHVLTTMFRHAGCYRVLGPVFYQLKTALARYWTQPQDLRFLCRAALRRAAGPRRLQRLQLPAPLRRYVDLE